MSRASIPMGKKTTQLSVRNQPIRSKMVGDCTYPLGQPMTTVKKSLETTSTCQSSSPWAQFFSVDPYGPVKHSTRVSVNGAGTLTAVETCFGITGHSVPVTFQ